MVYLLKADLELGHIADTLERQAGVAKFLIGDAFDSGWQTQLMKESFCYWISSDSSCSNAPLYRHSFNISKSIKCNAKLIFNTQLYNSYFLHVCIHTLSATQSSVWQHSTNGALQCIIYDITKGAWWLSPGEMEYWCLIGWQGVCSVSDNGRRGFPI